MRKTLIILSLLFSLISYGQDNRIHLPLKFSNNDKEVAALQFVAGFADGWHESIASYHWGGGRPFWDARTSWKRKYYNYDEGALRSRFPGSKTWAVGFTDGYHLTRMINRTANLVSLVLVKNDLKRNWKYIVKKGVILSAVNRLGFYLSYNVIFK